MNLQRARSSESGWTLLHCLVLLTTALMIGNAGFLLVKTQKDLALNAAFGRTADALADGALELALAHIANGETRGAFSAELPTGTAAAEINSSSGDGQFTVQYEGIARIESNIRAERRYAAEVVKAATGFVYLTKFERR